MKIYGRSITQLVEEQLMKWQAQNKKRKKTKEKPGPIITVSRETGCGGSEVAKRLAAKLGMDLIGGQIIQKVAESVQMSEKIIKSLDEKERTKRDEWLTGIFGSRYIWTDQYFHHLTKVIGTIGRHGSAVIVGRGAHHILPKEDIFRIRFTAPMDFRISHMMAEHGLSRQEAEKFIIQTDANRRAFIRQYFHVDLTDPSQYDLIVNLGALPIDVAVETIAVAFKSRWPGILAES
ncbi:MAG: cytidylate kinase-like family protein [Deltaproteobacteria bacterium]|nr:cytidylate kinase-like family protein [Deltaproteobacteria bacterium]